MMTRALLLLMLLACTGCAQLGYVDQALALKEYADEKDAQEAWVKAHDARFEALWREAQQPGALERYRRKKDVVRAFGEPVLCRAEGRLEKCLYRRVARAWQSPKVYFYFDMAGTQVRRDVKDQNKE